jgi:hypothetical protein
MISQLRGTCTTDDNPDLWFPTVPNGGFWEPKIRKIASEVRYAINVCASCPIKDKCLEEGMKTENLSYGIWGGRLAGERIMMAKERGMDYRVHPRNKNRKVGPRDGGYIEGERKVTSDEETAALAFVQQVRPYLEV